MAHDLRSQDGVTPGDAELVVGDWRRRGFEPHRVSFSRGPHPTLSFVFEPSLPDVPPRVFAPPRPFRDVSGKLFTSSVAGLGSCTWLAAAGSPTDVSGAGVLVATLHRPTEPHRVTWAVHLHRLDDTPWADRPEVRLLGSIAREVVTIPLRSADDQPYAVSLYRDDRGDREASADGSHPVDDWMLDRMRASGARHAQLAIVRGTEVTFARAYTFAERGYPVATLDHALRLGSVSKAIVALALLRLLRDGRIDLDAAVVEHVSLRDLLLHRSGLRSFPDMDPTAEDNPLSEANLAALLGRSRLEPGDLHVALARLPRATLFPANPSVAYSNEGFVLLGELLSRLCTHSPNALDTVLEDLLRESGVDPAGRGVLAADTPAAARARGESPAHGSSPTFRVSSRAPRDLVDLAYATNLRFLGGAAGLSVPVLWIARLLARLDGDLAGVLAPCIADVQRGARATLGFYAGEPGWTKTTPRAGSGSTRGAGARTFRTVCLHHNGRVEGGSSMLMIRAPLEPRADHPTLSVIVAMNQLGDLYEDPHGRALFGILRSLTTSEEGP